jgi:hypothetical protein
MNTRKIQYAVESLNSSTFGVKINGKHVATTYEVQHFVGSGMKFSRRPFAGATCRTFKFNDGDYHGGWFKSGSHVDLCVTDTRRFFEIGKRTKTFSLWYKRV